MEQDVKKKMSLRWLLIGGILLIVIVTGLIFWIKAQAYETTDNAQLDCNIIPVRSVVNAYLQKVCFNDNERVKKGQVLFIMDTTDLKAKVEEADASLKIAKAKLSAARNKLSASIESADASSQTTESYEQNIISARANLDKAQNNSDRVSNLFKIKAATAEQLEMAETGLAVARADYAKAVSAKKSLLSTSQSMRSLAKSDENQVVLAEAQVTQCEAELLLATNQLGYAVIRSPENGIVSKRAVEAGQYISAGQSLCALVDNENLWITANFKETQLKNIKTGQDVTITLDAFPEAMLTGKIESFSGATGAKYALLPPDNATGNFIKIAQRVPVRISIDRSSDSSRRRFFPGLSAYVRVRKN